jgi:pimeloyl-ACP methyl ester carboxylesterase
LTGIGAIWDIKKMQTVTSKDGTRIAYDKIGTGPAVIFVTGATGTRSDPYSAGIAELLSSDFSAIYYDRRGRGDSTDTQPFSVEKEIEDIEAIIDAEGGFAYLYGLSSGGALALEATIALKDKVKKLAVYEIPYDESEAGTKAWHEYTTKLTEAIAADRRGDAIALFMKFVGVPDEMLAGMRQAPFWKGMEAVAPTLLYDAAALGKDRIVPRERVKNLTTPTFVIDGGGSLESMPFMNISAQALTKALPNATHQTLEGQTHDVDMKVLAPVLKKFFKA